MTRKRSHSSHHRKPSVAVRLRRARAKVARLSKLSRHPRRKRATTRRRRTTSRRRRVY